ncbi:MAG: hypothetical protein ACD_60C00128G0010 [uncultured bacterium]|nr:MAG: hypothetical protein ACD_60C00128G0010 [uncultured bacterium]
MQKIAVYTLHTDLKTAAKALAKKLQLPYTKEALYWILLTPEYLGLQKVSEKLAPLYIDFSSGKMAYRQQHASIREETLAKALGLKHGKERYIIDATAGLARDSFIIAALGFKVELIERSPIISALIEDAFKRARNHPHIAPIIERMHLVTGDAITLLANRSERPDIIYLDPMFPLRKKSALPKKDMQIFHDVIGPDEDTDELLKTALACAKDRVVVKRARLSSELGRIKPSFALSGTSSRFDIYLLRPHGHPALFNSICSAP